MKTQILILTAAIAFAMTSCQDDSLNDNIGPVEYQKSGPTVMDNGSDPDATMPFDFNEQVLLTTKVVKSEESRGLVRYIKPQTWLITGYGDSELENSGSWYVEIDLQYNLGSDAISGTLKFTFPDYGDNVTFLAYGGPVLEKVNDGDDLLTMGLALKNGTGRFEKVKFEGGGSIALTEAWKENGIMVSRLIVHGIFTEDNGE